MNRQDTIKAKLVYELIHSNLIEEYDFIDISYTQSRLNELKNGNLKKQISGKTNLAPCIKTCISNYGIVVKDER